MKRILRIVLFLCVLFFVIVIALGVWLRVKSPGETSPIMSENGTIPAKSLATIETVRIGGMDQDVIIRAADSTKAVILYLHGGPGSPEIAFFNKASLALEKDYVMVYWEQRGAGKSYFNSIPPETMNVEQFVTDTKEMSEYLISRFGKQKIHLMGHSWGAFLGMLTAKKYPALFHDLLTIGQVTNQLESERLAFEWLKTEAKRRNATAISEELDKLEFPGSEGKIKEWLTFIMTTRKYLNEFGVGIMHQPMSMLRPVQMMLAAPEYTFGDKMNFMQGSLFSLEHLWLEVVHTNLFEELDSLAVPVYICQGEHDYQTSSSLARKFYNQLKAPQKAFYPFEQSAHSPNWEEPEKFNALVRKHFTD